MALPDSPLVLNVSPNGRRISLKNVAYKRIVNFRLGEIAKKNGSSKLIRVTSPIEVEIDANQVLINLEELVDELRGSHKGRAELKVIEVTFEGGLMWRRKL